MLYPAHPRKGGKLAPDKLIFMKLLKPFVWPEAESFKCAKHLFSKKGVLPPKCEINSLKDYAERVKSYEKVKSQILYEIEIFNRVRYDLIVETFTIFCLQTLLPLGVIIGFLFYSPRISLVIALINIGARVFFYFFPYGNLHLVGHYSFEETPDACQYASASLQYYNAELKKYLSRE